MWAYPANPQKSIKMATRWPQSRRSGSDFGVEVKPGQDDAMILAIAVCVDAMSRD
jgi:uncharacterized protein YxjI